MPTSRCVRLMLVGIANGVKEMWIAQQPFLLFYYAWQYTPTVAWAMTNMLGRKRVQNFKAGLVRLCGKLMKAKCSTLQSTCTVLHNHVTGLKIFYQKKNQLYACVFSPLDQYLLE